ncbi:MAG: YeeE/YedE family protein [Nitrospirae bacterium]|nr:YeeE/YedE family protein [Nitrospirota bacterium]MDE3049086.1 YeeE/YedE family protein [Nitrospirota bacterium]MDE3218248.1 YeeE/YedE family protein [Nitrospirota bacterium]
MKLLLGLILGAAFGAVIQLSGASSYSKITNALRLKDLTIMKLILTAIGVGLIGVHLLDALGLANMKVKDLYLPGLVVAGLIFGVGFAVTGYCPGTALAAAAEGKPDAWATVLGGLLGALVFAFMFPDLETYLLSFGRYGPVTIHGSFGIQGLLLAAPLGALCLWLAAKLPAGGGAR